MAGRTILITGAAGFIGSHVVDRLVARGDRVVGLDNFNDYYDPTLKRDNVRHLLDHANFELVEGDIRDRTLIDRLFSTHRFSAVGHLAAMAGVRASVENPALYFDVNVSGSLHLLDAAHRNGRPNFVFASTSSAYGRTEKIPFVENDSADRPLAPYPASKRSVELLGHAYHHNHGLDFTAVRFFTVYGPRNRPDMLAGLALDACCSDSLLTIYEEGEMFRDWTFVSDIADGFVAALDRRLGYEVVNLGRGEPVRLKDFVDQLSGKMAHQLKLASRPMPSADVRRTFANIDKARRLLSYKPEISIEEGISALVEWFKRERCG